MSLIRTCEVTCMDVTPLSDIGIFTLWMRRMPESRRRKVASLRNAESQRLSLGVGLLLYVALSEKGIDGTRVEIAENEYGKPYFPKHPELRFSLSHAGTWAMCAVGEDPVGCDAERIGRGDRRIAERCFHEAERERLDAISREADWQAEFARIWTRKEARMKAEGLGLKMPMRDFSVLADEPGAHYQEKSMAPGYAFSVCTLGSTVPRIKWDEVRLT